MNDTLPNIIAMLMRFFLAFFICLGFNATAVLAQLKPHLAPFKNNPRPIRQVEGIQTDVNLHDPLPKDRKEQTATPLTALAANRLSKVQSNFSVLKDQNGRTLMISGNMPNSPALKDSPLALSLAYLEVVKKKLQIEHPEAEFKLRESQKDKSGGQHLRLDQYFKKVKVYGGELAVHLKDNEVTAINGFVYPTPQLATVNPSLDREIANEIAKNWVSKQHAFKVMGANELELLGHPQLTSELVIYHQDKNHQAERLAWWITLVPHFGHEWLVMVDAHSGEVLTAFDEVCHLHASDHSANGPTTARAIDLQGRTRTLNVYETDQAFFMIDASRNMFNSVQSQIPNDPAGVIWTLNAEGKSPGESDFQAKQVFSFDNNWNNPTAVSAHYNAGRAYEYFRTTFGRNSINGEGGRIVSFIDVTDQDGQEMDNAFWQGTAMFYGNGDFAFTAPTAKSLDVAGHEMSHGVIQYTANLEYFGESGSLNESFADVFGVMIDRDDWQLGEDIVNRDVFRTGALRDLQNPNNGGSSLNSPGWQPASVSEQYFGNENNGGVHINSGIPNRAFYLIASTIGRDVAEQIYYDALNLYLVRSSQFVDMRVAVTLAAIDEFGENSNVVQTVRNAFNAVGILVDEEPTIETPDPTENVQCELEVNPGEERVVFTDSNNSALYLANPAGELLANPYLDQAILSKPSVTDNGRFIVFVADDGTLRFIDTVEGETDFLESNPQNIWRNVVISPDGSKLAAITDDLQPNIVVLDFISGASQVFELTKPTTAQGVSTGNVEFADAMVFDYDGEFLIYDAFNELNSNFGENLDYWDISFIRVWDKTNNRFGDGLTLSLFTGLEEDISIGNPAIAKNSPCVIAFDYIDAFENANILLGYNYETNQLETIFNNSILSFPSYSVKDDAILFDTRVDNTRTLALRELAPDKISPKDEFFFQFVDGGSLGVWFALGNRSLSSTTQLSNQSISIFPTLVQDQLNVAIENPISKAVQIRIVDVLGNVVHQITTRQLQSDLNLSHLPTGTYFIEVDFGTAKIVDRLVKQ